jgi:hypothetical protein
MPADARKSVAGLATPEHALCFPNSLAFQRRTANPRSTAWPQELQHFMNGQNGTQKSPEMGSDSKVPGFHSTPETMVQYLYERQRIVDVLNEYTYTLDSTMNDISVAETWASLFTEDCVATYPFGTHHSREGLAKFGMETEARFKRMQVGMSSCAPFGYSSSKSDAFNLAAYPNKPHR